MEATTVRTRFPLVPGLLMLALLGPSSALACVVGNGTNTSCTEAFLDDCLPGGGSFDGTVTFACGGAATITLTGTKTISADTTIDGDSVTTIDGGGNRLAVVNAGVTLALSHVTITGGHSADGAGAIANNGTVTVTDAVFSGNSTDSVGGGAIRNTNGGMLTVTDCTFSENSAPFGGAIDNSGSTATVRNSTFSRNSGGNGGAIASRDNATLTVFNTTFADNGAGNGGGAIQGGDGTLTVTSSTFSGNRSPNGAIGGGTFTLTNTILANNVPGNCAGFTIVVDGGHNIDDGTTCGFTGTNCATTTGTSFCSTNPKLAAAGLTDNGGPTETIALDEGSPAIDAGDETVCSAAPIYNFDQRGFDRPGVGASRCSIGAYEYKAVPPRCGDVNGDGAIDIGDALIVAQYDVGVRTCGEPPFSHPEACNVNPDGACDIGDALKLALCDVGTISCEFACSAFPCR